ncbi:MAG TPA: EAL domain-containing protein [Telmatospirillum sp.]|nr:EAL domain-containing protein [Telmatospirillum sp.]
MLWRWVFLCCLLLPASVRAAEPADVPPLTVVSDDNYPPYIFRDGDGTLQGYLVDAWALWERKTGRPVRLIATDWVKAQQMMIAGQGDVIDTIFQTPEREKLYDFTPPYADIPVPIYVHASIGGITNTNGLRGFLVGVKAGDACIDRLRVEGLASFQVFDSYVDLVDAAVADKIKIFCLDEPPANYLLYRAAADGAYYKAFTLYSGQFHRAVHKGDRQTLDLVERGFAAMTAAERQALQDKWMGARNTPFPMIYIIYGLLAAVTIGGVLASWIFALHHQVWRRTMELDQQRSRLRAVLQTIPDLVWLKDADGVYLTCNPPFERFFGAPESEIVGKTDFDFVDAELARFFREKDQLAIAAGKPSVNEEWVTFASDGRRALLETIKTPMKDDFGTLVGVLGIARDITQARGVEAELRRSEALLQQSQRLASIGHFVLDEESGRLKTSSVFDQIFGIEADHPRSFAAWLAWVHPDHRTAFAERMRDFLREGGQFEWEYPILRTSDGTERWVKMSAESRLDKEGRPANLFGNVQDITEHKTAEAEIQQLAFFDPLTKLPNRRLLLERLSRAKAASARNAICGALIFIDIDNFKTLNDTKGHQVGDLLLQDVAKRLNSCVRQGDTVARFGGDEFIVMVEALSGKIEEATVQADAIGEKILLHLAQPYSLAGYQHHCAASLGITLFSGTDVSNDDLLKQADLAMYQSKAAGRNTKRFFDPQMQNALAAHTALEDSLRRAGGAKEFILYYQPQMARNGDLVGAEGLIRWRHPTRGLVLPGEFIPVAESSNLILSIGLEVLEMACRQLVAWSAEPATRALSLAINVSARQFHHPAFVEDVRRTLDSFAGASPAKLKLELTESVLLQDIDDCAVKMTALQNLGVRLSLDDFGTGYSSLAYLKRLPFSQLKIDRSFVRDVLVDSNDAAVARTIILLAKSFGLKVIAEGVEEEAQWQFLTAEGCDEAQGYLYGRPMPADEFLAFAKSRLPVM